MALLSPILQELLPHPFSCQERRPGDHCGSSVHSLFLLWTKRWCKSDWQSSLTLYIGRWACIQLWLVQCSAPQRSWPQVFVTRFPHFKVRILPLHSHSTLERFVRANLYFLAICRTLATSCSLFLPCAIISLTSHFTGKLIAMVCVPSYSFLIHFIPIAKVKLFPLHNKDILVLRNRV